MSDVVHTTTVLAASIKTIIKTFVDEGKLPMVIVSATPGAAMLAELTIHTAFDEPTTAEERSARNDALILAIVALEKERKRHR